MAARNAEIAAAFRRLADLLDIDGANPFRVNAYRVAASTLHTLPREVADMLAGGEDLSKLPGIGADLAGKIRGMVETGSLSALEALETRVPPGLAVLLRVPGLGPKRVRAIYQTLGIDSLEALGTAARDEKLRLVPGISAKTEAKIHNEIAHLEVIERRLRLADAEPIAASLERWLRSAPGVQQVTVAGSFRRRKETVGDLDIVVAADAGPPVINHFVAHKDVRDIVLHGGTRSGVRLRAGLNVDLRVVKPASFGAAQLYFTGARAHTIALRKRAMGRAWKLNEYGLFDAEQNIAARTETDIYGKLGLPYIMPVLREHRGEIAAAEKGTLPVPVQLKDIRGDLHSHTSASDGSAGVREMAEAAQQLGYEYLAITDYAQCPGVASGLSADDLLAQIDDIDALNEMLDGIHILKSCEVEILDDGRLNLEGDILERLDFTVSTIHSGLSASREALTERVLRAMDNPNFNILAHPTGRLINRRPGCAIDLERVMRAALERDCFLELNAQPSRLDLDDLHCKMARDMRLKVPISTDAHTPRQLEWMRFGVDQAERGWLETDDVLNTQPLHRLLALMRR